MKKILLKIKTSAVYNRATDVTTALNDLKAGESLPLKVLIQKNEDSGKIDFFAEDISPDNAFGFLSKKQDDEKVLDYIDNIVDGKAEYTITLKEVSGTIITAEMEYKAVVKKKITVDTSKFDTELERIISNGIRDKETMDLIMKVMKEHRFPDQLILMVLAYHTEFNPAVCNPKTIYVDPAPENKSASVLSIATYNAIQGNAMIYEGDKSVGKNVCAETVAWLLNQCYGVITFNRRMTNDDVYGTKSTDNTAVQGLNEELAEAYINLKMNGWDNVSDIVKANAIKYENLKSKAASVSIVQDPSVFVETVKNGGVLCFNEMNMAEPNFLAGLANPLTDGSRFLDIPGIGRIPIHPKCVVIGTQNADYTGVNEQNDATMSRFGCIQFEYPKSIRAQLEAVVGIDALDKKYFINTDKYYASVLKAVQKGTVTNSVLNMRGFIRALIATATIPGFTTLSENIVTHVINTCPEDDRVLLIAQLNDIVNL